MKSRFVVVANVALLCALAFMDTGCKTKDGKLRWPWQKEILPNNPELQANTDVPNVFDDRTGALVSGARFEDTLAPVEGVKFAPVYFALDSYALAPSEGAKADQVAQHLLANAGHVLVVEGHCDERGSNEYNLALGENRALALRDYLTRLGVSGDRIQTRSYGEEKPAVAGAGEEAWRLNRRGEFALYQK